MARLSGCCTAVLCFHCFNEKSFGGVEVTGRRSRRAAKSSVCDKKDEKHVKDKNGCTHGDMDSFQTESNTKYFDEQWRKDNPDKCIDIACMECGKSVI